MDKWIESKLEEFDEEFQSENGFLFCDEIKGFLRKTLQSVEMDEDKTYKILTDVAFEYKKRYMRGDKVGENCFIEQVQAIAREKPFKVKEKK